MAPREATGTFPDQFLTFDFESAAPLGVPTLHDANAGPPNDDGNGDDPHDAAAAAAAAAAATTTTTAGFLGDALNHVETGTGPASGAPPQTRPGHGTDALQVDPLSIDPTLDQQYGAPAGAAAAPSSWPAFHQQERHQQSPHVAAAVSTSVVLPPHSRSSSSSLSHHQHRHRHPHRHPHPTVESPSATTMTIPMDLGNPIHDDASSSGPLSTGTSYLHTTTAPNSPLSFASSLASPSPPSPSPSNAASSFPPNTIQQVHRHDHHHQHHHHPQSPPSSGAPSSRPNSSSLRMLPARNLLSALSASVSLSGSQQLQLQQPQGQQGAAGSSSSSVDGGGGGTAAAAASDVMSTSTAGAASAVSASGTSIPRLDRTFDTSFSTAAAASASASASTASTSYTAHSDDAGIGQWGAMDAEDYRPLRPPNLPLQPRRPAARGSVLSASSSDDEDEEEDEDEDDDSVDSLRMIYRNSAFDDVEEGDPQSPIAAAAAAAGAESMDEDDDDEDDEVVVGTSGNGNGGGGAGHASPAVPNSPTSIMLSFGPNTTVSDLKYFAERGCIVALLQALTTPRLVTLGTRMLADYAKMAHRRVAVASNRRILEFVQRTMLQVAEPADWLGREYAVETVRSLTATEESDRYLMGTYGLLNTLALVARGGPFVTHVQDNGVRCTVPLASEKARLHACIAIMNLSCGKANKIEIAKIQDVLEAMRDVMLNSADEARLKATTCIKNLSNADANDAALLGTPGLVEALGHVASVTCSHETGATPCTTNACLALMNLSISKANKHRVYRTPGVMDSLMTVLDRTTGMASSAEARVKACSALSNLAIGYDNKIPMFSYPGFVEAILRVIQADSGESRTKACSILWSFAAEMKNQVPVVQRGDILPTLVRVADEDGTTEARFKCVAALTLLAESLDNAIPLLEAGALHPLMDILHEAGPDPTQWKGQTASWCVGFLMNIAQSDDAVPSLREAGVVELLAPLLTLDHYQSLKAAMAVTFCCRFDEGDECYDLLRKTENVIPKIISLLHNTLSGRGGNGYKYGVFTLRSSVGCISALALGPDFMKERIATGPVFESLLRVVTDFCVNGGTPGAIVGGGRDDALSATLAVRALQSLTGHLIPIAGSSALPFGQSMEERLLIAFESFECCQHPEIKDETRQLATDARIRIEGGRRAARHMGGVCNIVRDSDTDADFGDVASMASHCCGFEGLPGLGEDFFALTLPSLHGYQAPPIVTSSSVVEDETEERPVRTFLLSENKTGRRFVVPVDPSGGRAFNDSRLWCYRRGRFCMPGEEPDPDFVWTSELQQAYEAALSGNQDPVPSPNTVVIERWNSS